MILYREKNVLGVTKGKLKWIKFKVLKFNRILILNLKININNCNSLIKISIYRI